MSADAVTETTTRNAAPAGVRVRSGWRSRLRCGGLLLTALLPQPLKRAVYRWCFGYRVAKTARVGVAYLDCEQLEIGDEARIAHGCVFWSCGGVRVGSNAVVGPLNLFRGGREIELGNYSYVMRLNVVNAIPDNDCTNDADSSFSLGYGAVITAEHRIDFTDRVRIGRCSIFGGRSSSIWTHNVRDGRPVEIGDYCYIGSEIRMAPGARVPDCSIVGLGSVITRPLTEPFSLYAGVPAERKRALGEDDLSLIFGKTRPDLPDQDYPRLPAGL